MPILLLTLENGTFSLDNVPAGNYTLNVYTDDYGNYSEDIEVVAGEDKIVNVVFLLEEPGAISGKVVDSVDSISPIIGATVSVALSGDVYTFNSSALTDVNGEFTIEQLPVGFYTLTVLADYYNAYLHAVEIGVTEGTTTENIEIELIPE